MPDWFLALTVAQLLHPLSVDYMGQDRLYCYETDHGIKGIVLDMTQLQAFSSGAVVNLWAFNGYEDDTGCFEASCHIIPEDMLPPQ